MNPFASREPDMLLRGIKGSFSREEGAHFTVDSGNKAKDAGSEGSGGPA
jgi:hypothetical protein